MKLTTHHLRTGAALLLAGILLAGCDQSSSDAKHIKVGVINGAEQDVAEVGNDSNLLIVFYVQIMPDDLVMQLHRF